VPDWLRRMPRHAPSDFELAHRIRMRGLARQSEILPEDPVRNAPWCRNLTLAMALAALALGLFGLWVNSLSLRRGLVSPWTQQHEVSNRTPVAHANIDGLLGPRYEPIYEVKTTLAIPSNPAILIIGLGALLGITAFFLRTHRDHAKRCALLGALCCIASIVAPFLCILLAEASPN
jgi:hypothetical protein